MQHFRPMFTLRRSLLQGLIRTKLHGFPGFSRAWPLSSSVPDRTTLWRWLNGKSQIAPGLVLALAGTLDLDPFALFEITPQAYAALCRALVRNIGTTRANPLTHDLQWLASFVAPSEDWPTNEISARFFKRPWAVVPFRHSARDTRNVFQKLSITALPRMFGEPQVWHFACRDQSPNSRLWIPYGFVERRPAEIALFHYHVRGHSTRVETPTEATTFVVETWFGPGSAEFRVASLHDFKLVMTHVADRQTPCVRFP
jgi:hypothetical protein